MHPLVSIIVPVYNAVEFLRPSLDSICNQSYRNLEIILVNDGSLDGTAALLDDYSARDARIRVLHKIKNQGSAAARNDGLEIAQGEFVMILDSDDLFELDMVEVMLNRAMEQGVDMVLCNAIMEFSESCEISHFACQDMRLAQSTLNLINCCPRVDAPALLFQIFKFGVAWNKLLRTEFVRQHGLRFQLLSSSSDFYFSHTALIFADSVSIIDRELVRYQVRTNSISHSKERNIENALEAIIAVKQFMMAKNMPSCMFDSLALFAKDLLGWNLYNTAAASNMVCKLIAETIHRYPELLSHNIRSTSFHLCVFDALHCPEICLILPNLSPQRQPVLFKKVQQLISGKTIPLYPLRILYANDNGEPIARELLSYPIAMPVQVPKGANSEARIDACRVFPVPHAKIEVWPGCDVKPLQVALRRSKISLCISRMGRIFAITSERQNKVKTQNRLLRARIYCLELLLDIITQYKKN